MNNLTIFTHVFNEGRLFLPLWLKHHRDLADQLVIVDDHSTDNTREIIKELAPQAHILDTWRPEFNASDLDIEMMQIESNYQSRWKLILNITEFIYEKDLMRKVEELGNSNPIMSAFGLKSVVMVDPQELDLDQYPIDTRHYGYVDYSGKTRRHRYIHRANYGYYHIGRHGTHLPHMNTDMLIKWYGWSPYPQCLSRKMQIQTRIPESDKAAKLGFEHIGDLDTFNARHKEQLTMSHNLLEDNLYVQQLL